MARPRVFVSSTYYDLKHLRASLDSFIEALGYDAILSEKGEIAFVPDRPLDESCYREVRNADIFVLIIGGRYGTAQSSETPALTRSFYERYNSITMEEYRAAVQKDIPIYILVDSAVHSEYRTYLRNKENKSISYAHVDSVNVFVLIEEVLGQPRNNPVHEFSRPADIESWLREQWAGLFKELIGRMSGQAQMQSLSSQVALLQALNETLKSYLESVLARINPKEFTTIVQREAAKLEEIRLNERLKDNRFLEWLGSVYGLDFEAAREAVGGADSIEELCEVVATLSRSDDGGARLRDVLSESSQARKDLNGIRRLMARRPFRFSTIESERGDLPDGTGQQGNLMETARSTVQ